MHELIDFKDIFDALILLEETGRDAYAALAHTANDPSAKALFLDLSKREEAHRILYARMKNESGIPKEKNLDEEYKSYLSVLIEHNFSLVQRAKEALNWEDGILAGIELEKQTILFLSDLYRILEGSIRDPIPAVIKEEQNHLKALLKLKTNEPLI